MNWLDIILIIINVIVIINGISYVAYMAYDEGFEGFIIGLIASTMVLGLILLFTLFIPFVVIDKGSGSTIGTITSVDKNFFGTTSVYVKTSETTQENYCIEFNEELENKAKELIGKEVKINYGERVGLYSTGKCHQAPIDDIEEVVE